MIRGLQEPLTDKNPSKLKDLRGAYISAWILSLVDFDCSVEREKRLFRVKSKLCENVALLPSYYSYGSEKQNRVLDFV